MQDTKLFTLRPLTKGDQEKLARIFKSVMDSLDDHSLAEIMQYSNDESESTGDLSEEERTSRLIKVFMLFVEKALANLYTETSEFLASLIGKTLDEYRQMPFDIDIQVLEALKKEPGINNFFTGASRLFSGAALSERILKNLKTRFASITDSILGDSKS